MIPGPSSGERCCSLHSGRPIKAGFRAKRRLHGYGNIPLVSRVEPILVVEFQGGILIFLAKETIADDENVDLAPHKAAECVLGRADDRLAAHIEAGIDQNRAAGQFLKAAEQRVVTRIGFAVHGLDRGRNSRHG